MTDDRHVVLVNDDGQYTIVPIDWNRPEGWAEAGFTGDATACATWVERVWTDLRPLSLRSRMERSCNHLADL